MMTVWYINVLVINSNRRKYNVLIAANIELANR